MLPRVVALSTYVDDEASAAAFWQRHFALRAVAAAPLQYVIGDVIWRMVSGGQPCGTKGPHGVVPAWRMRDFAQARGTLLAQDVPIVFEEMLPGANLLVFLDAAGNAIELLQVEDAARWQRSDRRALRTRQRRDAPSQEPLELGPLQEVSIYTPDITASVRFYRDVLGLPTGLAFFGHVHLAAENAPLVLRSTNTHCQHPERPHGTEVTFGVPDWPALRKRLQRASTPLLHNSPQHLTLLDPTGLRVSVQPL